MASTCAHQRRRSICKECKPWGKKARQEHPNLGWKVVMIVKNLPEAKKYLEESTKAHCNGLPWLQDGKEKGKRQGVTNFCCNFKNTSGCKYKTRSLRDYSTDQCIIEETSSISHADHRIHQTAGHVPLVHLSDLSVHDMCSLL